MSVQSRLWGRVQHMVTFGRTTGPAAEAGNVSMVQVRVDDLRVHNDVPVASMFGFQSSIPEGTDVARVSVSGDTSNGIIVATNHIPSRMPHLPTGGSRMHDAGGCQIVMHNDGSIEMSGPGEVIHPLLTMLAAAIFNTHTHAGNGQPPTQQMTAAHWTTATKAGTA